MRGSCRCRKCGHRASEYSGGQTITRKGNITIKKGEVWVHCPMCGDLYPKVELHGGITITHPQASRILDNLPRKGTKLSLTLGALASLGKATTGTIALRIKQTTDDTASQLTVLQGRGLVMKHDSKRGVAGGSTWELTPEIKTHFGVVQED